MKRFLPFLLTLPLFFQANTIDQTKSLNESEEMSTSMQSTCIDTDKKTPFRSIKTFMFAFSFALISHVSITLAKQIVYPASNNTSSGTIMPPVEPKSKKIGIPSLSLFIGFCSSYWYSKYLHCHMRPTWYSICGGFIGSFIGAIGGIVLHEQLYKTS